MNLSGTSYECSSKLNVLILVLDQVNIKMLHHQQLRHGLMKAAQALFSSQNLLRQIMCQVTPRDPSDLPPVVHDDEPGQETHMLMQQLMQAATQPSPLKAIFSKEEMEVTLFTDVILLCFGWVYPIPAFKNSASSNLHILTGCTCKHSAMAY